MTNPTLLSYSSVELLHSCPRKYELLKLLSAGAQDESEAQSIDLVFGSACGSGIQELFRSGSLSKAIFVAFSIWSTRGLDLDYSTKKKSFSLLVKHLEKFAAQRPPELIGWELVELGGVPAIEVGFSIRLSESYSYRGFIDLVLYHPIQKLYKVVEIKTDGQSPTPAKYQNSFQGSSYQVLLEKISGLPASAITYLVLYCPSLEQLCYEFPKNPAQKLDWLVSLAYDCKDIDMYRERQYFPKRGKSCYEYYRPCIFLGLCDLKSLGRRTPEGSYIQPEAEDPAKYQYHFTIEELFSQSSSVQT